VSFPPENAYFRIFNAGNPALDNIRMTPQLSMVELNRYLGMAIKPNRYIVLIHHPLSSDYHEAGRQMETVLQGVENFCLKYGFMCVGTYPNTDPGAADIIRIIDAYKNKSFIRFFKTLPRDMFVNLMRHASALIGNSSMGLLEAPFYKLPVVNTGNRQKGRLQVGNVKFVGYTASGIIAALRKACLDMHYRGRIRLLKNPFGNGHSAGKIKRILASVDLSETRWYIKRGVLR